ncbi:MAG: FHA domain-containing protein [Phycisphaerales bacterium]|nr:FHA domain-containing protein [Phycisphaerae bacterium]NNF42134.1 FHA domain-containing protein [Phycisphaerales bacterium]NNM25205.1 FHA domain-containing protein [Phycisphaerales bacterium]
MATLLIVEGPASGRSFALGYHPKVLVGRDEYCSFQVTDDQVSRRHLQIRHAESELRHYARDAGSANGVYLNDERLADAEERVLKEGDMIRIGQTVIMYHLGDSAAAESALKGLRAKGERRRGTIAMDEREG